eukprot:4944067-Pyramimonas_sp.AAC.1
MGKKRGRRRGVRRRRRRRRRRTSANPRRINDFAINPSSKFRLHRSLQNVSFAEGSAPVERQ